MDILIKGMEMPKDGMIGVFISSDGNVYDSMDDIVGTIVPVPPHGRLIDADALLEHMKKIHDKWKMGDHYTPTTDDEIMTMNMPTIIEAEEGE